MMHPIFRKIPKIPKCQDRVDIKIGLIKKEPPVILQVARDKIGTYVYFKINATFLGLAQLGVDQLDLSRCERAPREVGQATKGRIEHQPRF